MLAGLLFANAEAPDRPGRLAATLPFGGLTLIEFQARALIAAGATQLIVAVTRVTPELLGALGRIRRRGVAVDPVRNAQEAAEKLHPLARILMLADGLVTSDRTIEALAVDGGDALLVLPADAAGGGWERVGGQMVWAGVARLEPQRVTELARLPVDYDMQSALLRLAEQAGAVHVALSPDSVRQGHGIEHRAGGLAARGRLVLAGLVAGRRGWFDRFVAGPLARWTLPPLVDHGASGALVGGVGATLGVAGLIGILAGWVGTGAVVALAGCLVLELGTALSGLRDESRLEQAQVLAVRAIPAAVVLAMGIVTFREGSGAGPVLAIAAVASAVLAIRSAPGLTPLRWWGTPPAYLLLAGAGALLVGPVTGLALTAGYAAATLGSAIERWRAASLASS
jgi:hypothetical protein